ncbi:MULTISPECIES: hypothetical protein [Serratia]|uniref:hypothetical protein n=1 Tax=Serratia TaxID=613 RepID=UPI001E3E44B8|nr:MULTISPECIES: hypothetical protein [Serratia]
MRSISSIFTLLFIVLAMLGTVKVYIGGNLNWLILLLLLGVATVTSLTSTQSSLKELLSTRLSILKHYKWMLAGWVLFIAGIFIAALMNDGTGLYTVVKYLLFVIVLLSLLLISPLTPALLEKALNVSLIVSLLPLLVFAVLRQTDYLLVLGDGRMGWLASWPGVIWKAGAYAWPFIAWRCLKNTSWRNLLLAFCAILIMALDGSRTSMLWMALVWCALAVVALFAKIPGRGIKGHIVLLLITLFSFTVLQPTLVGWVWGKYDPLIVELMTEKKDVNEPASNDTSESNDSTAEIIMDNLGDTVKKALSTPKEDATADRLIKGDNTTRLEMIQAGWHKAVVTFPWGGGFGATRVADNDVTSVIHMTYVQLLADEGVLSFIGYLLIILAPLCAGLKFVFAARETFIERFELMLAPLSALALFTMMGCFHPLSNELTEWGIVLVAMTLVMTHVTHRK